MSVVILIIALVAVWIGIKGIENEWAAAIKGKATEGSALK